MTKPADLAEFESRMAEQNGWNRRQTCEALGISQGKLRRALATPASMELDRTLGLAMAAVREGLLPYGER